MHIGGSLLETATYAVKPRTSAVCFVPWRLDFCLSVCRELRALLALLVSAVEHDPGASIGDGGYHEARSDQQGRR